MKLFLAWPTFPFLAVLWVLEVLFRVVYTWPAEAALTWWKGEEAWVD